MTEEPLLGRKVDGRFTITRFLGEGGMAKVFVAEQDGDPKEVALKVMNVELTNDRTFVRRFQREAQAAARVQHPSSVKIFAYGVEGDVSYIAMELLHGDDLYALLDQRGALSQKRAARILVEVCEALAVAHEIGIVHRDLKPENIMLVKDPSHPDGERVKVLDFGIAKLIAADAIAEANRGDEPNSAVTRAGTFIGTPAYMSPEQCSLQAVDTRADIYTCGVLLYQLVTGRVPFEGETPLHTATLHIHQPPPKPSVRAPEIDPRLEQIILKALAKKPSERHQTARHLGATLKKILPELPDVVVASDPVSAMEMRSKRPGSLSLESARSVSQSIAASLLAEREPDAPIESARTIVQEGVLGPPPPVVLHPESIEEPDVEPADSSDPVSDLGATLVRNPKPDAKSPMSDRSAAPIRTEVIGSSQGRAQKATLQSAGAFGKLPAAPKGLPSSSVGAQGRAQAFADVASSVPVVSAPKAPEIELDDEIENLAATAPIGRMSPLAAVKKTLPLAAARDPIVAIPAPAPPSQPRFEPPRRIAETTPMHALPQAASNLATPFAPAQEAPLSSGRGMLIGFVAGLLVMGILAIVYFAALR